MMFPNTPQVQHHLLVWLVLVALMILSYNALVLWYAWPGLVRLFCCIADVLKRQFHCVWCWHALHLPFPSRWSSSMCPYHHRRIRAQAQARRARRRAMASASPAVTTVEKAAG